MATLDDMKPDFRDAVRLLRDQAHKWMVTANGTTNGQRFACAAAVLEAITPELIDTLKWGVGAECCCDKCNIISAFIAKIEAASNITTGEPK